MAKSLKITKFHYFFEFPNIEKKFIKNSNQYIGEINNKVFDISILHPSPYLVDLCYKMNISVKFSTTQPLIYVSTVLKDLLQLASE